MAVDTLFNDVRLLLQSGSLTNAAASSPASVSSLGVTAGAGVLTFTSTGTVTATGITLASPSTLATLELVVTPTWAEYSKIASMLGLSLNAISPGVIGIYSLATDTPSLVGSLTTAQSGEITLIAEYAVSGANIEIKLTAVPFTGITTTTTVSTPVVVGLLPTTLVLGGQPSIPVPVPGASASVTLVQAPRAAYSQQQIASLRNTNPSNSIIYTSTPISITAVAGTVTRTYTVTNPVNRTVDDVLSELALGISQQNGAALMAETGYFVGVEARASLRLTFTPVSSDVANWVYSFSGLPSATATYFLTGVYGGTPPLSQISTATFTFTPGQQNAVTLTAFGITVSELTTDMPAFVAAITSALHTQATVSGVYPFAGQCIIYVTGAVGVGFTMSAMIASSATVPSGISTLKAARVTAKRRYTDLGATVEYATVPWPTSSIPPATGGGGGPSTPTVWDDTFNASDTITNGGRTAQFGSYAAGHTRTVDGKTSGVWYFEVDLSNAGSSAVHYGLAGVVDAGALHVLPLASTAPSVTWYAYDGTIFVDATSSGTLTSPSRIVGVELNAGTRQVRFRTENGVSGWHTVPGTGTMYGAFGSGAEAIGTINAGQVVFAHGLPPGATAWGSSSVSLSSDVWLALSFESGYEDLSQNHWPAVSITNAGITSSGSRTGDKYVAAASSAVLDYAADLNDLNGTTDITVEFDIWVPDGVGYTWFFGAAGSDCWVLETPSTGTATVTPSSSWAQFVAHPVTFSTNAWHHVAWSGTSANLRSFVDGVGQSTGSGLTPLNFSSVVVPGYDFGLVNVAERPDLPKPVGLRLDNVVITKAQKYTANFTPPSTGVVGGGVTLDSSILFAVNAENSTANDLSQHRLPATITGGTVSFQSSGSRTGDAYIGNTNGNIGVNARVNYYPTPTWLNAWSAATAMTLEFDIYNDQLDFAGGQFMQLMYGYATQTNPGGGKWSISSNLLTQSITQDTPALDFDRWYHIAAVGDATTRELRLYVDGVQVALTQSVPAGGFQFETYAVVAFSLLQLHDTNGNGSLNGRLDNVIITKTAKYTANFTPATTFNDLVGYTPPPSGADVTGAGYNDIDSITGTGTFNTQLTAPDAYFFSASTLEDVGVDGALIADNNSINFTSSRVLANATCTGTFVRGTPQNFSGNVTLDDTTAASTFYADLPVEWDGGSVLDDTASVGLLMFLAPSTFIGATTLDDIACTDSATDVVTPPTSNAAILLPALTAVSSGGGGVRATLPTLLVDASATAHAPRGVSATLQALTVTAQGGHQLVATLPRLSVSAQATTTQLLRAQVVLPPLTALSTGRVAGQAGAQSFLPAMSAVVQGGHQAQVQLPGVSATAHVVSGVVARVEGKLPSVTAYATGYRQDTMRATLTLPAIVKTTSGAVAITLPQITVTSSAHPTLADTHEAYVLNMNQPLDDNPRNNFEAKVEQVTRYTNWPFIQVVRLGTTYYGVAADGLYELGGATDNGTEIAWSFETCKTDFKDPHKKTVASAYVAGQSSADVAYTLRSGDDTDRMYDYTTTRVTQKRNHRQKFGLGRRVRYYSFGLAGEGKAAIDSIEFELTTTTRRV